MIGLGAEQHCGCADMEGEGLFDDIIDSVGKVAGVVGKVAPAAVALAPLLL